MLAKEIVFVIAVQFSRGKEIREQGYYYETIAMSIQIGKRLGQRRNEVGKGGTNNSPGAESLYGGAESLYAGAESLYGGAESLYGGAESLYGA